MTSRNILKATAISVLSVLSVALVIARVQEMDNFTCDGAPHRVNYGDTLWAIAEMKCDGNIQVAVDNLVEVYGTTIQPNQDIWLPTSQDCLLENRDGDVYDSCE